MPRGRSINLHLPETRELVKQREFRARKAARLKELEEENARLLKENESLRAEVTALRRAAESEASRVTKDELLEVAFGLEETAKRIREVTHWERAQPASHIQGDTSHRDTRPDLDNRQQEMGATSAVDAWRSPPARLSPAPLSEQERTVLGGLDESQCCFGWVDCGPGAQSERAVMQQRRVDGVDKAEGTREGPGVATL